MLTEQRSIGKCFLQRQVFCGLCRLDHEQDPPGVSSAPPLRKQDQCTITPICCFSSSRQPGLLGLEFTSRQQASRKPASLEVHGNTHTSTCYHKDHIVVKDADASVSLLLSLTALDAHYLSFTHVRPPGIAGQWPSVTRSQTKIDVLWRAMITGT